MIKLGIIGHPLGHTLSPIMHKAALEHLGIRGDYLVLDTPPDTLIERIKFLKIDNYKGFNVTIPLKVWIVPLLNDVDEYANMAGAVNTVIIREDKSLIGYNTDIDGFMNAIPDEMRNNLKDKSAVVLGSGGAARAVAVALGIIGVKEIVFYARNIEKAKNLEQIISANFTDVNVRIAPYNEYAELNYASILVNATPIGMEGAYDDISPLHKRALTSLPKDAIVYDLIYKPAETKLLKLAKEENLYTINGLEMLVLQGAKALSIWLNHPAPVDIMRQAALKNIGYGESQLT